MDKNQNLIKSSANLYMKDIDLSKFLVPKCNDFVVYLIKKNKSSRIMRFY